MRLFIKVEGMGKDDEAVVEYRRAIKLAPKGYYLEVELTGRIIDIYRRKQSLAQLPKSVPVTSKGTFAITSTPANWSGGDAATKLRVSVTGAFSSATAAKGTISITETGANGSCGPIKMTFVAKLGGQ